MRPKKLIQLLSLVLAILSGVGSAPADGAVYGEDHRQTEEGYADSHLLSLQDLKDSVAATGVITCARERGTAQLTLSSDVLTTAAHVFLDSKTCKPKAKISACNFTYKWKGVTRTILVAEGSLRTKYTCPFDSNKADDWAVVKLSQPAIGPMPYQIDETKTSALATGDPLLAVEGLSVDFCTRRQGESRCVLDRKHSRGFVYPKTLQDCTLTSVENPDGKILLTDCAGSHGASGSGIFSQDDLTLLGIHYTDAKTETEGNREILTGRPIVKPYDRLNWSASEIPVSGAFADAIYDAAGKPRSGSGGTLDRKVSR